MKIRRAPPKVDPRDLPLDTRDHELLARIRGAISIADLVAGTAWDATDSARRINRLMQLGLVERVHRSPPESCVLPRHISRGPDPDDAVTLKPERPLPVSQMFRESETRPVEIRTPHGAVTVDAVIARDRHAFSRATLVDTDPESAFDLEETPYSGTRTGR